MALLGGNLILRPLAMQELLRGPKGPVFRKMVEDGEKVKVEAKRLCPRSQSGKTGMHMADRIIKRFVMLNGEPSMIVGVEGVPYARFVHEGTPPHVITGNPLLAFFWPNGPDGAKTYFFRSVNHPGTKPNPFLTNALKVLR